ncbi:LOW QUALITY PROTEIN: hypothetical protein T265_14325 [Opisthorchis viverrini]|uniref:Uncharacterized protein n=1 Tax=Opisthorchis viverrini TaxID=6198 RepID=A0A074ZC12_OPIVI|nr:LOW QUALITY PROTEIN: hypothetical protein T265_14325 [Opisthorchis viverrini]KER24851.1 LOW QUALITY PROTEIN: hypothetical protein T265_14325 [Opisthorchis viverrini]
MQSIERVRQNPEISNKIPTANRIVVEPFQCIADSQPEGSTTAEILPGCPKLDRSRRDTGVGFEPHTFLPTVENGLYGPHFQTPSAVMEAACAPLRTGLCSGPAGIALRDLSSATVRSDIQCLSAPGWVVPQAKFPPNTIIIIIIILGETECLCMPGSLVDPKGRGNGRCKTSANANVRSSGPQKPLLNYWGSKWLPDIQRSRTFEPVGTFNQTAIQLANCYL